VVWVAFEVSTTPRLPPNVKLSSGGRAERSEPSGTRVAAAVCLYVQFTPRALRRCTYEGVARRSFRLLRYDLLLQIDPSRRAKSWLHPEAQDL